MATVVPEDGTTLPVRISVWPPDAVSEEVLSVVRVEIRVSSSLDKSRALTKASCVWMVDWNAPGVMGKSEEAVSPVT